MNKGIVCMTLLIVGITTQCIEQEPVQTTKDWKGSLYFVNPPMDPRIILDLVTGFGNMPPAGTLLDYRVELIKTKEGTVNSYDMTMQVSILEKEIIDGKECTALHIFTRIKMKFQEFLIIATSTQKEWIDSNGALVKLDVEDTSTEYIGNEEIVLGGMEIPIKTTGALIGEEYYNGHECWIFLVTYVSETGEIASKTEVTVYLDKETRLMVRKITTTGEKEEDSGYIEPVISPGSVWVLGPREKLDTSMGEYDCQVIYIKKSGEIVGKIWVSEEMKTPLKYVYFYETEELSSTVTMTLIWYSPREYAFF
ncbi:MAG: hypothetical protein HXS44_01845 [Theionarchaea archaeon]|nr:hypothetical protein [Theionarchaea archaeon]